MKLSGRIFSTAGLSALTFLGAGCNGNPPSHQDVQQQAAQATAVAKQDAQDAVAATRQAAGVAAQDVNDVAKGVKQGIHEDAPRVDLNTASQVRLATLPGISLAKAGEIVNGRPYASTRQLVSRGLLTGAEYDKVAPDLTIR